eukprot:7023721-Prorocentrum_lima.AAC.1
MKCVAWAPVSYHGHPILLEEGHQISYLRSRRWFSLETVELGHHCVDWPESSRDLVPAGDSIGEA